MEIYTLNEKGRANLAEELDRVGNTSLRDWLVNSREECLNAWVETLEQSCDDDGPENAQAEMEMHQTEDRKTHVIYAGADWFDVTEVSIDA